MKLIINHFKVYNSTAFSTFTLSRSHHPYLVPRHFYYPPKETLHQSSLDHLDLLFTFTL